MAFTGMGSTFNTQPVSNPQIAQLDPQIGLNNQAQNAFAATGTQYLPQLQNSQQLSSLLDSGATLYGQLAGAQNTEANNQYGTNSALLGIKQSAIPRQLGVQGQLLGLANQGFGLQSAAAQQQAAIAQRNLVSQSTANGSMQSAGTRLGEGDIQNQLQNQLGQIGVQQQTQQVNTQEAEAQLHDTAKEYGVDATALRNTLQSALSQLGLQNSISVNQLMAQKKYLSGNDLATLNQWINSALSVAPFMSKTLGGAPSATPQ